MDIIKKLTFKFVIILIITILNNIINKKDKGIPQYRYIEKNI